MAASTGPGTGTPCSQRCTVERSTRRQAARSVIQPRRPKTSIAAARSSSAVILDLADEPQHALREPVDVGPGAITDAVPVRGDVDHVAMLRRRRRNRIMRLL